MIIHGVMREEVRREEGRGKRLGGKRWSRGI